MTRSTPAPEVGVALSSSFRSPDLADLMSWCQEHAARVQWGISAKGRHVLELAVPLGTAQTRLVTVELNTTATPHRALTEAVDRMQAEMLAATRRGSFRLL